jgi:hypothetical protein
MDQSHKQSSCYVLFVQTSIPWAIPLFAIPALQLFLVATLKYTNVQ